MKTLCLLSTVVLLNLPAAFSEEIPPFLEGGKYYNFTFSDTADRQLFRVIKEVKGDWIYIASPGGPGTKDKFLWVNLRTVSRVESTE